MTPFFCQLAIGLIENRLSMGLGGGVRGGGPGYLSSTMSWPTTPFGKSRRRVQISFRGLRLTDFSQLPACIKKEREKGPTGRLLLLLPARLVIRCSPSTALYPLASRGRRDGAIPAACCTSPLLLMRHRREREEEREGDHD